MLNYQTQSTNDVNLVNIHLLIILRDKTTYYYIGTDLLLLVHFSR